MTKQQFSPVFSINCRMCFKPHYMGGVLKEHRNMRMKCARCGGPLPPLKRWHRRSGK